jgi:hypothetical protein
LFAFGSRPHGSSIEYRPMGATNPRGVSLYASVLAGPPQGVLPPPTGAWRRRFRPSLRLAAPTCSGNHALGSGQSPPGCAISQPCGQAAGVNPPIELLTTYSSPVLRPPRKRGALLSRGLSALLARWAGEDPKVSLVSVQRGGLRPPSYSRPRKPVRRRLASQGGA